MREYGDTVDDEIERDYSRESIRGNNAQMPEGRFAEYLSSYLRLILLEFSPPQNEMTYGFNSPSRTRACNREATFSE